jgi:hypothetical protein
LSIKSQPRLWIAGKGNWTQWLCSQGGQIRPVTVYRTCQGNSGISLRKGQLSRSSTTW